MNNADMPAMPIRNDVELGDTPKWVDGLTKREHFAAMAMQGILSNPQYFSEIHYDCDTRKRVSDLSWEYADALLAALESH